MKTPLPALVRAPEGLGAAPPPVGFFTASLAASDPEIAASVAQELEREQDGIELIASENIVSRAVMEAQGSVMTNKYAEGYPGRRYYGGCEAVDIAERLAIERACKLFECGFANVQPHSGAQANGALRGAIFDNAHHAGGAQAAVDGDAPLGQLGGHQVGGTHFLKAEFRVGMNISANGGN